MTGLDLPRYRLLQLGAPDRHGHQRNEAFADLDGLVTHHPGANRHARVVDGVAQGVENARRRSYGVIGGELQELETARTDEYGVLTATQVLLVKDFILEDSRLASGAAGVRDVDVPSPVAGYVGRVDAANGVVDILDRRGGEVIARARHLNPIAVEEGQAVGYGQSLGTQHRQGLSRYAGKHVHFEIDTRYYRRYESYVADLASGRLAIDPGRRIGGIDPREPVDDGVIRIGDSGEVVRVAQRRLNAEGFRDADGGVLVEDGVYRLSMQAAVINYQQARHLPPSGDLDPATLRELAPRLLPPDARPEPQKNADQRLPWGRSDDSLLSQAEAAVRRLDRELGQEFDERSACMAASAACLARTNGLARIDHIVLSREKEDRCGENLFVVQGALGDPARRLAWMRTDDALAMPVAQSLALLAGAAEVQGSPTRSPDGTIEREAAHVRL